MSKEEGLGIELIRFPIESYLLLAYMKSRGIGGGREKRKEGEPKKILLKKKTHWKKKKSWYWWFNLALDKKKDTMGSPLSKK